MQRIILALLVLAAPFVFAQTQPSYTQLNVNDQRVLQYALILEELEYTFYNKYQAQFTAAQFVEAGLSATDYNYLDLIKAHEQAHVAFLSSLVPSIANCTYNFPVTNVTTYIAVAALLENTGVSAYDGAIKDIYSKSTQTAAAVIATVEARHAQFLNRLNQKAPFPLPYDVALDPTNVTNTIFNAGIAKCTLAAGYQLPTTYVVQPIANSSDSSQPTSAELLANDITVLQYALFLEHLESSFYNYVVGNFNSTFDAETRTYINLIQQHEASHVSALTATINNLGGSAIPACTAYNFSSVNSITAVLNTAAELENTGVYAYDGAVNAIYDNTLKQIAATIATVEARHAGYLNELSNSSQITVNGGANNNTGYTAAGTANGAYDNAFSYNTIVNAVVSTGLLGNCNNAVPLLKAYSVLVVKPYTNTTSAPTSSPSTASPSTASPSTASPVTAAPVTVTPSTGATTSSNPTSSPTTRPTTRPSTTSDASIASASVAAALLIAMAAL